MLVSLEPVGDGSLQQWTLVGGSQAYALVQDHDGPDDDAGFLSSNAGPDKVFLVRTETGKQFPIPEVIAWVSVAIRTNVTNTGLGAPLAGIFKPRIVSGAQTFDGAEVGQQPTGAWVDRSGESILAWRAIVDPATAAPWTLQAALAAEVGLVDQTDPQPGDRAYIMRCTWIRKLLFIRASKQPTAVRAPDRFSPPWR